MENYSRQMESKKKNKSGTQSLGTLKHGNPVNQKDGTPNKWEKGTVCIERGSRLNGINQILISQNRPVKVLQFLGATINSIYDHFENEIWNILFYLLAPTAPLSIHQMK